MYLTILYKILEYNSVNSMIIEYNSVYESIDSYLIILLSNELVASNNEVIYLSYCIHTFLYLTPRIDQKYIYNMFQQKRNVNLRILLYI